MEKTVGRYVVLAVLLLAAAVQATVTTDKVKDFFTCDGSTQTFNSTVPGQNADDFVLKLRTIATGDETTLTETTDYSITATNNDFTDGCTITTTTAYADTYELVLIRVTPLTQPTTFANSAWTTAMNRLVLMLQELSAKIDQCVKAPDTDPAASMNLPSSVSRANKAQGFDDDGKPIASSGSVGEVPVSTFMETVVTAADANAARTLLETPNRTRFDVRDYGAVGDGATDDTAAITRAVAACPVGGTLLIPACSHGFKITSTVTIEDKNIIGVGEASMIKIALTDPTTDGIVIRHGAYTGSNAFAYQTNIRDFAIVGTTGCCRNALVLQRTNACVVSGLNIMAGATQYGLRCHGVLYGTIDPINMIAYGGGLASYNRPANGILVDHDPNTDPGYQQSNCLRLRAYIQGVTGIGIKLDGTGAGLVNTQVSVSGAIEFAGTYPIYALKQNNLHIYDMYMSEGNRYACVFDQCYGLVLGDDFTFNNDLGDGSNDIDLTDCNNVSIRNSEWDDLITDANTGVVVLGEGNAYDLVTRSEPGRTVFTAPRITAYANYAGGRPSAAPINLISNGKFAVWGASPTGWGTSGITWTQCGSGKADANAHGELYCGKATFTSSLADLNPSLASNYLNFLKGKYVSASIWAKLPSGQSPVSRPYINLYASSPTWGTLNRAAGLTAANEDNWAFLSVGIFVPSDATVFDFQIYGYQTAIGGNTSCYFSECVLTPGWQSPMNWIPTVSEMATSGDDVGPGSIKLPASGGGYVYIKSGTGDPNNAVTAPVGSMFLRTDGGTSTTLYIKQSGTSSAGWVAK